MQSAPSGGRTVPRETPVAPQGGGGHARATPSEPLRGLSKITAGQPTTAKIERTVEQLCRKWAEDVENMMPRWHMEQTMRAALDTHARWRKTGQSLSAGKESPAKPQTNEKTPGRTEGAGWLKKGDTCKTTGTFWPAEDDATFLRATARSCWRKVEEETQVKGTTGSRQTEEKMAPQQPERKADPGQNKAVADPGQDEARSQAEPVTETVVQSQAEANKDPGHAFAKVDPGPAEAKGDPGQGGEKAVAAVSEAKATPNLGEEDKVQGQRHVRLVSRLLLDALVGRTPSAVRVAFAVLFVVLKRCVSGGASV